MASLNKVQLIGNLGADPDIRTMSSGDKVANIRIATTESWKDKASGEKRERTEWHSVVIFGGIVEAVVAKYLKKGSPCYVEGQLQTRKWQDASGADRWSTEVVIKPYAGTLILLGGGSGGGGDRYAGHQDGRAAGGAGAGGSGGGSGGAQTRPAFDDDLDDDVPF